MNPKNSLTPFEKCPIVPLGLGGDEPAEGIVGLGDGKVVNWLGHELEEEGLAGAALV